MAEYRNDFGILNENIRLCLKNQVGFFKMMIIDHGFFCKQQVIFD
jgi:hypothetical protein